MVHTILLNVTSNGKTAVVLCKIIKKKLLFKLEYTFISYLWMPEEKFESILFTSNLHFKINFIIIIKNNQILPETKQV